MVTKYELRIDIRNQASVVKDLKEEHKTSFLFSKEYYAEKEQLKKEINILKERCNVYRLAYGKQV